MTVSNTAYLKGFYDQSQAMGAPVIASDFAFEIVGFESMWLSVKQAPDPVLSPGGEIEVAGPLGMAYWDRQQVKVNQQGAITIKETIAGSANQLLIDLIRMGGAFDAKIYEGTPQRFLRYKPIYRSFIVMDNPDRNWDDRAQPLVFSGTLFFHYFGEIIPGNSKDYR